MKKIITAIMGRNFGSCEKSTKYSGCGTFVVNSGMPITIFAHKSQLVATILSCFIYFSIQIVVYNLQRSAGRYEYDISVFRLFQFQEVVQYKKEPLKKMNRFFRYGHLRTL